MPRFYLHLHNDIDVPDPEGVELSDLAAARASAVRQARELLAEAIVEQGRIPLRHRIDIEDQERRVLHTLWFGDAVVVEN